MQPVDVATCVKRSRRSILKGSLAKTVVTMETLGRSGAAENMNVLSETPKVRALTTFNALLLAL